MSGDSSSDFEDVPHSSKSRQRTADQKRKRIVIVFDDSGDETSSSTSAADDLDNQPSCSSRLRSSKKVEKPSNHDENDSNEEFLRNASKRLNRCRTNVFGLDDDSSGDSSSGSEITRPTKKHGNISKQYVVSEDENELQQQQSLAKKSIRDDMEDEAGFNSDSSSNELLEKCPICLLTFRQQEIGSPSTCEHIFCANCIEAWSKNVQTCPIDRLEFAKIIVRGSYENRTIVREININTKTSNKELILLDDVDELDDAINNVTNCEICNSPEREDVMLLCDSCNQGYHIDCLSPPLSAIPEGSWYCDNCFDSQDENDEEVEEDLNMLYEDIRDMGIPETRLRVTEVQQPRILRTRQNERIREAVLRRTRAILAQTDLAMSTIATGEQRGRGRPRNVTTSTTTTTTTTTTRTTTSRSSNANTQKRRARKRRRRARHRTYVVEYDLNNYNEKFALKTTKKVIRRRRRKQRKAGRVAKANSVGTRLTRLAEQLGLKHDTNFSSQVPDLGGGASFSLFGNANDLEYFSDSDPGGNESNGYGTATGHGTAVQTAVRFSNIGPSRARKGLLSSRLQNGVRATPSSISSATATGPADLLSSIIDMQDRWHKAAQNMEKVHINPDGTLKLPQKAQCPRDADAPKNNPTTPENGGNNKPQNPDLNDVVTQAPMYKRGAGNNPNFNSGGGGGGNNSGNYNNRYSNQSNYRGNISGSGNNNQYRHSTGGSMNNCESGDSDNNNFNNTIAGGQNFNFNSPNYNANRNQNTSFPPFNIRFNQRNQNNNNNNNNHSMNSETAYNNSNLRNSLPFSNNNTMSQPQNLNISLHQQQSPLNQMEGRHFSGPPPPQPPNLLFSGIPPLTGMPMPPIQIPPSNIPGTSTINIAPILTIPPPPAPPPAVHLPWNTSLFQLTADYGNDDDDSNCPNFSVYSAESQEVAKSTTATNNKPENADVAPKLVNRMTMILKSWKMCPIPQLNCRSKISSYVS